ncbi:alpha-galactosidase [Crossiella sp. CA198]|uniref:alpha-galactosidase n=1 Tax=Crossiella sp. CA198 TaxID=3455607 RepID=UPI003F8D1628
MDTSAGKVAQKPYLGWSSWSLQATKYPGVNPTGPASWLTEQNVLAQADVVAAKLRKHGYEYVNVDAGWAGGFDEYRRPLAHPKTFPRGIKFLGDYLHRKGLTMGSYLAVGLDPAAYRPMEFLISWALTHTKAAEWKRYTTGWRIDTDVECYCETLVKWDQSVRQRWTDVVQWIDDAGPEHSKLDSYGLSLITNDEVIAVNQAGKPARPVSQASDQQVWSARNDDGSHTVALFNLGSVPATVRADWRDLGFTGEARVRDLWSHRELGRAAGFPALLPAHGSRLLRVTPPDRGDRPTIPTIIRGTGNARPPPAPVAASSRRFRPPWTPAPRPWPPKEWTCRCSPRR